MPRSASGLSARSPAAANLAQGAGSGGATATGQQSPFGTAASAADSTGYYMGAGFGNLPEGMPRVVPNIMDNSILIQATAPDYERILKLLKELDVPPRQVLIEAKIYEVTLTGAFASGVSALLQRSGSNDLGASGTLSNLSTRTVQAATDATGLLLTAGMLVGQTRQLLGILSASEDNRNTKVISAPMLIATDSIPASINVGQDVPTLTSQALTGAQSGGNSLFANTISSRNSGVTLSILARVTDSGIVTLVIDQEVSSAQAPSASAAIQSPSFQTRSISTQVTVQDGDTIAIGGIIQDTDTSSSAGVPFLHRLPVIGAAFGAKSTSKGRTELVIFMTPRVIYDTNAIAEASDEVKSKLKRLTKIVTE
jgi:general secretion pathway protein D